VESSLLTKIVWTTISQCVGQTASLLVQIEYREIVLSRIRLFLCVFIFFAKIVKIDCTGWIAIGVIYSCGS